MPVGESDGSESRVPFTRKRVHLDLLRDCGVRKQRCELDRNRDSCRCTRFLSSIAEQNFLRRAHLASYAGPLTGLPSLHHALHASLLLMHNCDSVLSLNRLALLGFSSGSVFCAASLTSHATCLISWPM